MRAEAFRFEDRAVDRCVRLGQELCRRALRRPADLLQPLATIGRANWISAHYSNLTIAHATVFLFFVILFRFALVPRLLAGLGMLASAISTTTVASMLMARPIPFSRGIMPLGIMTLVLVAWLLWRGLANTPGERRPTAGPLPTAA